MAAPTDYHANIRTAVKDALDTALAAADCDLTVHEIDDLEGELPGVPLPAVVVACVGPDGERPEFSTNLQDGRQYPIAVALLTTGVANAAKSARSPEVTVFRRIVSNTFNNARLSGVSQVAYCEVGAEGPLIDRNAPLFQRLSTMLVVNAIGRFPRS